MDWTYADGSEKQTPAESEYILRCVDESGAAVGFLTVALPTLHGNLVPVVPINIVYTVINDLLVQG